MRGVHREAKDHLLTSLYRPDSGVDRGTYSPRSVDSRERIGMSVDILNGWF